MISESFVKEIDRLSADRFQRQYPADNIRHAAEVEWDVIGDRVPGSIRYAFFKLTMRCNSDCEYCEHAYSKNQGRYTEQPIEVLLDVVDQLGDAGVCACSVSGGEPLTYTHIDAVIEKMVSRGIEPILLTNGILLPSKAEQLYSAGLRYVIMSIDSFNPDHYKKTRGISLDKVSESYSYMVDFVRSHPDMTFRLTTVLSSSNTSDVVELIERATSDGVGVQLTPYHNFINSDDTLSPKDIEEVSSTVDKLLQMKDGGAMISNSREYLRFFPRFFAEGSRIPHGEYRCRCGYEAVYVWPDLSVKSCWSTTLPVLGNLRENSLSEIWAGEEYRRQRRRMLSCQCEGCWLLCTAEFNIALDSYLSMQMEDVNDSIGCNSDL